MGARLVARLQASGLTHQLRGVIWDSSPGSTVNYDEFIAGTWASVEVQARRAKVEIGAATRAALDALLDAPEYKEGVRSSYAPMLDLLPFPVPGLHHLFLYIERDP